MLAGRLLNRQAPILVKMPYSDLLRVFIPHTRHRPETIDLFSDIGEWIKLWLDLRKN